MKKDPDKMKRGTWKKVAAAGLCISMLLGGISLPNSIFTVEAADNTEGSEVTEEAPVQATFSEKVSDDKRKTEITFRVSYDESDVEIVRIETPDKTAAESKEEAAYTASENGNYDFTVVYREILSGEEKEEIYTYTVTGLMAATAEDTTGTETEEEKAETEKAETGKTSVARAAQSRAVTYPIAINEENFPDTNFRNFLLGQEYGLDGQLTEEEIAGITSIDCGGKQINSLEGIGFFTELSSLLCDTNNLTELDVSANKELWRIECFNNYLTELDVSANTRLNTLECGTARTQKTLQKLILGECTALTTLDCGGGLLTELDVSKQVNLRTLRCDGNQLLSLDVTNNSNLQVLECYGNQLTELDVTNNTQLTQLHFGSNKNLSEINLENNTLLTKLQCGSCNLKVLDVTNLADLVELSASTNQLDSLDVTNNTKLETLYCGNNNLTELDVSKNTKLITLYCQSNQIKILEVDNNKNLQSLYCSSNEINSLDVAVNTQLKLLNCSENTLLTGLDVSKNTNLEDLDCSSCGLSELEVTKNTKLTDLICDDNNLSVLDLSKNTKLGSGTGGLDCSDNQLTSLDLTASSSYWDVKCMNNQLTSLKVGESKVSSIWCRNNKLAKIDGNTANFKVAYGHEQKAVLPLSYDADMGKWKTPDDSISGDSTSGLSSKVTYDETRHCLLVEADTVEEIPQSTNFVSQYLKAISGTGTLEGNITFTVEKDIKAEDGVILPTEARGLGSEIKNLSTLGLLTANPENLLDGVTAGIVSGTENNFFSGTEGSYQFSYNWENIPAGSGTESASHTVRIVKEGSYIPDDRSWSMYAANISLGTSEAKEITAERLLELAEPEYAEVTGDVVTDLSKFSISTTDVNKVQNTQSGEVQINITHTTSGNSREITVSVNQDDPIAMIVIPAEIELDPVDNSSVYEASKEAEVKLIDSLGQDFDKTIDIVASDSFDITDSGSGETLNCGVFVDGRKYDGASPLAKLSSSQNNQRFEVRAYKRLNITGDFKGTMNFTVSFAEGD